MAALPGSSADLICTVGSYLEEIWFEMNITPVFSEACLAYGELRR